MRRSRSITLPIILASITVALSVALLIGWTLLIMKNRDLTQQAAQNAWLLVGGIVSFVFIGAVLVWMVVFLVGEILEVRRQTSFMDSVTHELKSPLASLLLCAETLQRPGVSETQRSELFEMMTDDIDRLNLCVDDILVASRLAHGKQMYQLSPLALSTTLHELVERVGRRYKLSETAISIECAPHSEVNTDLGAFDMIFNNLLDNAIKYSGDEPQVVVRVHEALQGELLIEVEDRGIGLSVAERKRVFERFYRSSKELVQRRRGTGLGLFVVASLVRQVGGRVGVNSQGVGEGCTFQVRLPCNEV